MGKKASKRTKNFQKNHLQSSVANRRRHQKISRTDEKKKRNEESRLRREIEEAENEEDEDEEGKDEEEERGFADAKSEKNKKKKELEEMDIDEFLDASDDDEEDDDDEDDESSEDDDSDDEDEEDNDDAKTREEMKQHKKHLESLKETDPEFYEYLQQEDKELLEFDDDEEDDSEEKQKKDESSESDSEKGGSNEASKRAKTKRKKSENRQSGKTLTSALVKKLCENAKGGKALGAAKHLFTAYRAACHYGDEENENDQTMLKLASSSAFNDLVQFVLAEADDIFRGVLGDKPVKSTQEQYDYEPMKSNRWKKVEPVVKSYIGNTLHLLGQLTDASMTSLVLRRLAASVAFLKPFERLTKRVTRTTLMCFSSGEPRLRVSAIVLLRAIAATCPGPALERAVKGVYRAYASNAKFMNANSAENIAFMSACVVEMFGIDQNQSYGLAFAYIRQLATLLRNALAQKTKDAFKSVYCWQYINCLECFERILTAHASNREYSSKGSGEQTTKDGSTSVLRPLAYPVQQIALGAARVLPSARYAPLRIRLLKILNRLSRSMETFAPVAPLALELLNFSELYKAPMSTKTPSPDFTLALRVSKTELRSPAVQDVVVESAFEELGEHLEQHAYSVAFPEISHAVTRELKRFNKKTTIGRFKKQAKQMLDAIERNADYIERKRDDEADFAPKDIEKAKSFLHGEKVEGKAPLTRYVKQLRDRGKERRAAMQAMDVSIRSNESHGDESSSSDDDDDDGDDEDDDHRRGDEEEDEDDDFLNGDNDGGDDDDEIIDGDEAFEEMKKRKRKSGVDEEDLYLGNEDLVKELELSSDEENDDEDAKPVPTKKARKKGGKK